MREGWKEGGGKIVMDRNRVKERKERGERENVFFSLSERDMAHISGRRAECTNHIHPLAVLFVS